MSLTLLGPPGLRLLRSAWLFLSVRSPFCALSSDGGVLRVVTLIYGLRDVFLNCGMALFVWLGCGRSCTLCAH